MSVAIRQDIVGDPHCQNAIQRFAREARANIRVPCPRERCGTEYAVFYGPVMDAPEVQRLMLERMTASHPAHEIIGFPECWVTDAVRDTSSWAASLNS